jgi:hypothetical protein
LKAVKTQLECAANNYKQACDKLREVQSQERRKDKHVAKKGIEVDVQAVEEKVILKPEKNAATVDEETIERLGQLISGMTEKITHAVSQYLPLAK